MLLELLAPKLLPEPLRGVAVEEAAVVNEAEPLPSPGFPLSPGPQRFTTTIR